MAHPARAERPERAVAAEDELLREGGRGHPAASTSRRRRSPFPGRTRRGRFGRRSWSQRDDDIEFDFFEDEPATSETAQPRACACRAAAVGRRRRSRRSLGPPRGVAPLLRLLGLVVVRDLPRARLRRSLIQSCASTSKHDAYASYMERRAARSRAQSTANGKRARDGADDAGPHGGADRDEAARASPSRSSRTSRRRRTSTRPGGCATRTRTSSRRSQLRVERRSRASPTTFQQTASSKNDADATRRCSPRRPSGSSRATSSGTTSSRAARARAAHAATASAASPCPTRTSSRTATSSTAQSMALVLQRLRGADDGRHADRPPRHEHRLGEGAAGRPDAAAGDQLNTVTATHRARVRRSRSQNSGDSQEVQIPVTLTIEQGDGQADREDADRSTLINPGEQKTVTFTDLGAGAVRDADDGEGRRRSRCRARRTTTTTRPSTRSSSRCRS